MRRYLMLLLMSLLLVSSIVGCSHTEQDKQKVMQEEYKSMGESAKFIDRVKYAVYTVGDKLSGKNMAATKTKTGALREQDKKAAAEKKSNSKISTPFVIAGVVVVVILLVGLYFFMKKRRRTGAGGVATSQPSAPRRKHGGMSL